jgi:diguanylate cyclase (GGDEF)-like protein
MRMFRNLSVRRKITLIIMIIVTVTLLVSSVAFITSDRLYTQKNVGNSLSIMADMIAANSTAAILFGDSAAAAETLGFLGSQENIEAGVIYDAEHEVFARYNRNGIDGQQPAPPDTDDNMLYWSDHIDLFRTITYQGEKIGSIYLRSDLRAVHERLARFLAIVAAVLAGSLLVAFALIGRLQHVVTAPLLRLSVIARRISIEKNYSLRVLGYGNDEIGTLIHDFNNMLDEIQLRDDQLKVHRQELEKRVMQRTHELELANRQLAESKEKAEHVARHMEYHAHHDTLTGLPNRALLDDRLRVELSHARRDNSMLALLFLDLDRFKIINDSLGHATGDQLLRVVSQRLHTCLRDGDTVARLGGDEFMVLLPRITSSADAGRIGNKIIESLNERCNCNGHELHITTSIGISVYPHDGSDIETLVKHADISMYRAKEIGRNKVVYFTREMNLGSSKRLALETSLRRALENDELRLYYQPKVDITRNRITGVEALVRWEVPGSGFVSPLEFIPIAEESGLIVPLGEWVLRTALVQLQDWHAAGFAGLTMSVNLSSVQLARPGFENIVESALVDSGIDPGCVELEVTENVAMKNVDSTAGTLHKLKKMGLSIAMDDFGTGYSSLGYLRRLPIDTVKLDKSFVRGIPDGKEDALIAQAIVAMTASLNIALVVEGVENLRQLHFFRQLGCNLVQGYLFSAPVPAADMLELLHTQDFSGSLDLVRI